MKVLIIMVLLSSSASACLYEDVIGSWTFYEGKRVGNHTINCNSVNEVVYTKEFTYQFPNTVIDELGNYGTWTLVSSSGFETNINGRSYYAFFSSSAKRHCEQTSVGFSRDKTVRNWACYYAQKTSQNAVPLISKTSQRNIANRKFINNYKLVERINSVQTSWKAKVYPEHEQYTLKEMFNRGGGQSVHEMPLPKTSPATAEQKARVALLPKSFDWRDIDGVNYVSPVRDQKQCGSCYAFASTASIEARLRIATRNQRQDIFSPQDIVECTSLSSGCHGGYIYLIAGRYAEEQGLVDEQCNPYKGYDNACSTDPSCPRTYVSEYQYVGGFYGGCNEELMIEALVTGGPLPVAYYVYDDFYYYEGGVYKHTNLRDEFNPYEPTNHAVTLVGYGVEDSTGEKFWTIKNSWGDSFGESGYFRILRGTDECSIESKAVTPFVIP